MNAIITAIITAIIRALLAYWERHYADSKKIKEGDRRPDLLRSIGKRVRQWKDDAHSG